MKHEDKFKAAEFLRDIGLGLTIQPLLRAPADTVSNVIKMPHHDIVPPIPAIQFHIDNLIATYGEDTVKEAIDDLYRAIGWDK